MGVRVLWGEALPSLSRLLEAAIHLHAWGPTHQGRPLRGPTGTSLGPSAFAGCLYPAASLNSLRRRTPYSHLSVIFFVLSPGLG